jgi:hypothetical protein
MTTKAEDLAIRAQLRLAFAALFMHAEIGATIGVDVSNEELAARALRRADMLFELEARKP